MKTILLHSAALLVALALPAMAGPFGLPDHVQDGWRDTGCDEAFNVEIKNDEGEVLYLNNPTCPDPSPGDAPEEDSADGPGDGDGGEGPGDGHGHGPKPIKRV